VSAVLLAVYALVGVAVVVAAVLSLFVRRHGESERPAAHWLRTDETFLDPTTGRQMRVWVEPAGGQRHYVADT
jgi:hypothetical protein